MIEKLISVLVAVCAAAALVWWFNDSIEAYYQRPLIEAFKKDIATQKAANIRVAKELKSAKAAIKTVYVDRVKEIKVYEESLTPDAACRADPAFARLYNRTDKR